MNVLYRMYDRADVLLYVGMTTQPAVRYAAHRNTKPWWPEVDRIDTEEFDTWTELAAAEKVAIKTEAPRHNVVGRESQYEPSEEVVAAIARYEEAKERRDAARQKFREWIAAELVKPGATAGKVAKYTPWSAEVVRQIAREYGVPRKRKPTVVSIKTV